MNISLNDKNVMLEEQISLAQLLQRFKIQSSTGVAVAVNEMIIPKQDWSKHNVNDNDKVLVITATQGG